MTKQQHGRRADAGTVAGCAVHAPCWASKKGIHWLPLSFWFARCMVGMACAAGSVSPWFTVGIG